MTRKGIVAETVTRVKSTGDSILLGRPIVLLSFNEVFFVANAIVCISLTLCLFACYVAHSIFLGMWLCLQFRYGCPFRFLLKLRMPNTGHLARIGKVLVSFLADCANLNRYLALDLCRSHDAFCLVFATWSLNIVRFIETSIHTYRMCRRWHRIEYSALMSSGETKVIKAHIQYRDNFDGCTIQPPN